MPRGGKRDGAGRPKFGILERITLSFSCSPMMVRVLEQELEKRAANGDRLSRSELIEGILLDYFEG